MGRAGRSRCSRSRPRSDDKKTVFMEINLKVMIALRWLASGSDFDILGEISQTSETTARVSCLLWVEEFVKHMYAVWVHPPTGDDLKKSMAIYARLGFPGAAWSMDAVHVHWNKCPAGEFSKHKGKEAVPTLAYNVTVDYLKRILATTAGHPGAQNDKTIVRYDRFVADLRAGRTCQGMRYKLLKRDGTFLEPEKIYGLVDGG